MLGATGLFLVQYKRVSEKYNPFTVAFITTLIGGIMEAMDWFMNGMIKEELYALIPHCSANMVYHSNFFSTNQKTLCGIYRAEKITIQDLGISKL